jgi:hypothetical protein
MSIQPISYLKDRFSCGRRPTDQDFHDLIDTLSRIPVNWCQEVPIYGWPQFKKIYECDDEGIRLLGSLWISQALSAVEAYFPDLTAGNISAINILTENLTATDILTDGITGNEAYFTFLSSTSSFTVLNDIQINELSGFLGQGTDFNCSPPSLVDFTPGVNNITLSGLGISSTSWASFGCDVQVGNNLSAGNTVSTPCGDSNQWCSVYSSVCATSANWDSVYSSVCATSANWDSVYSSVCATSANWDSVYSSVCATSANWNSVYSSVCATSGDWDSVYSSVCATSGDWDSVYSSVCATSGDWDSVYATVCANSAFWDGDFCNEIVLLNEVSACSGTMDISGSVVVTQGFEAGGGITDHVTLFVQDSAVGVNTETPNEALTVVGNISSSATIYASCGNSNEWCSTYTTVCTNSAKWDSDFCDEIVLLSAISGCQDNTIQVSSHFDMNGYSISGIGNDSLHFKSNATITSNTSGGIILKPWTAELGNPGPNYWGVSENDSTTTGDGAHAMGRRTKASGDYSLAAGLSSESAGTYSVALGNASYTGPIDSYTVIGHIGDYNFSNHGPNARLNGNGQEAISMGRDVSAVGFNSFAQGQRVIAGQFGHAEGYGFPGDNEWVIAYGGGSHAEGENNIVFGNDSHVEGQQNKVFGIHSHAECLGHVIYAGQAHAEGARNTIYGVNSHAEGENTQTGELERTTAQTASLSAPLTLSFYAKAIQTLPTGTDPSSDDIVYWLSADPTVSDQLLSLNGWSFVNSSSALFLEYERNMGGGNTRYTKEYRFDSIATTIQTLSSITGYTRQDNENISNLAVIGLSSNLSTAGAGTVQDWVLESYFTNGVGQGQGYILEEAEIIDGQTTNGSDWVFTFDLGAISPGGNAGRAAHAEGFNNIATGDYSHVEGGNNLAAGNYSHAEGLSNSAIGNRTRALGRNTNVTHQGASIWSSTSEFTNSEKEDEYVVDGSSDIRLQAADAIKIRAEDIDLASHTLSSSIGVQTVIEHPLSGSGDDMLWDPLDELKPLGVLDASKVGSVEGPYPGVTGWNDSTQNNNDWLTQVGTPSSTSLNGLSAINFVDTERMKYQTGNLFDYDTVEQTGIIDDYTIFIVGKRFSFGGGFHPLINLQGASSYSTIVPDGRVTFRFGSTGQINSSLASTTIQDGDDFIIQLTNSVTRNKQEIRILGDLVREADQSSSVAAADITEVSIGGGSAGKNFTVGEFIFLNKDLSKVQRQKIEGYLAHKWGMESQLDDIHPYKTIAPRESYLNINDQVKIGFRGDAIRADGRIRSDCGNSDEWCSTHTTVSANSAIWADHFDASEIQTASAFWDSTYTTVCANSASWDGDFCNEIVLLNDVSGCSGTISITADTSVTGGLTAGAGGLTFEVTDTQVNAFVPLSVTGDISSTQVIFASCGNSDEWCSAYTTVTANSASWDGDFCNEVVLLNEISACNDTISISGNLNMNGHSISGIGNNSLTFESSARISSDASGGINILAADELPSSLGDVTIKSGGIAAGGAEAERYRSKVELYAIGGGVLIQAGDQTGGGPVRINAGHHAGTYGGEVTIEATSGNPANLAGFAGNITLTPGFTGVNGPGWVDVQGDASVAGVLSAGEGALIFEVDDAQVNAFAPLSVTGNISSTQVIFASNGNSDEWSSTYTTVSANSGTWSSPGNFVNVSGDTMEGSLDFAGTYNITNVNSITANEVHTISAFTHYQDIIVSELSGFNVTGNVDVDGNVTITGLVSTQCGTSNEWCSVYTLWWENSASLFNRWDSTYTTVSANSASWDGDFCNEIVLLNEISACNETINISGNLDMTGSLSAGTGSTVLYVDSNKVGINTTTPNADLTVQGDVSASGSMTLAGGLTAGSASNDVYFPDGIILRSPDDNSLWKLTVTFAGALSTTPV